MGYKGNQYYQVKSTGKAVHVDRSICMSPAVGVVAVVQLPLYPVVIGPLAGWLHFSLQVTAGVLQLRQSRCIACMVTRCTLCY
jgi:hypothetical protein